MLLKMMWLLLNRESDYGHSFMKGSDVIYKKDIKTAIVHKDSVLYVGIELAQNTKNPQAPFRPKAFCVFASSSN